MAKDKKKVAAPKTEASEKPDEGGAKVVALTPGAEAQPLDNTTRPATKKEAKQIADAAAANRPFQPEPPPINPPLAATIQDRNKAIARQAIEQFAKAMNMRIDNIMQAYDDAVTIHSGEDATNDKKFSYRVGSSVIITGDDPKNYSVDVQLSWSVKEVYKVGGQVRIANPGDPDLVDMAEANERREQLTTAAHSFQADKLAPLTQGELQMILDDPKASEADKQDAKAEMEFRGRAELGDGRKKLEKSADQIQDAEPSNDLDVDLTAPTVARQAMASKTNKLSTMLIPPRGGHA